MPTQPSTPKESILYYDQRSVALRTTQSICLVQAHDKLRLLELLLSEHKETQTIIVTKSKKTADTIATLLLTKGQTAQSVHGNHREAQQQEAAKAFSLGTLSTIVTTDMILKTLSLEHIGLLLSYDLPELPQEYYNRLALMKEKGIGIALVSPVDEPLLGGIEHNMKAEIEEKTPKGFVATPKPEQTEKKDRSQKPRHSKRRGKAKTKAKAKS